MALRKGLGKGLDALLGDFTETPQEGVLQLDVNLIDTNREQPRKSFDQAKLDELAQSITRHGMVQPIIVRKNDNRYTVVAGERRYRAARIAGLSAVPVIVKNFDDAQVMEVALIENLQREDLNPIEEAAAIKFLMQQHDLTQEEVASRLSKSRPAIANSLRLLSLAGDVQERIKSGELSAGSARAIAGLRSETLQKKLAAETVANGLSVRDVEARAKQLSEENQLVKPVKRKKLKDSEIRFAEDTLREKLGTKVNIEGTSKRGRVIIEYFDRDSLDGLYQLLMAEKTNE